MTDIAVGRGRVADVEQPARGRASRPPATRGPRRCAGTARPRLRRREARAAVASAPKVLRQRRLRRRSAEDRAQGESGRWPGTRGSRTSSGGPRFARPNPAASRGDGRCSAAPPSARRRARSAGSRRRPASRASPTEPWPAVRSARRTVLRAATRRSRSTAARPRARAVGCPGCVRSPVRYGDANGPWRSHVRRRRVRLGRTWVRQRCASLSSAATRSAPHHPGDGP